MIVQNAFRNVTFSPTMLIWTDVNFQASPVVMLFRNVILSLLPPPFLLLPTRSLPHADLTDVN